MPFVKKIETESGILGIWELDETANELEEVFQFSSAEKSEYQQLKFDKRKIEYLSTRLLIEILADKKIEIDYHSSREPLLRNESLFISISHSDNLVAVFLSSECRVGIDVERIDRNVEQVATRFLSSKESGDIQLMVDQQIGKILYWCAKESIFKCTFQKRILFSQQINISPFLFNEEGSFYGSLITDSGTENFKLSYFQLKNNMIVFCVPLSFNSQ